jgi:hypothetical protein
MLLYPPCSNGQDIRPYPLNVPPARQVVHPPEVLRLLGTVAIMCGIRAAQFRNLSQRITYRSAKTGMRGPC